MKQQPSDTAPWYRQFWPWFILALPATVVVAAIITVIIAYEGADDLVSDNYYRDGLAINQVLEQDKQAAIMSLSADVRFDLESGEVFVSLHGADTQDELSLMLLHPTNERQDKVLELRQIQPGRFRADLEFRPSNRFYLRLVPEPDRIWRLNGEIDFGKAQQLRLEPQ